MCGMCGGVRGGGVGMVWRHRLSRPLSRLPLIPDLVALIVRAMFLLYQSNALPCLCRLLRSVYLCRLRPSSSAARAAGLVGLLPLLPPASGTGTCSRARCALPALPAAPPSLVRAASTLALADIAAPPVPPISRCRASLPLLALHSLAPAFRSAPSPSPSAPAHMRVHVPSRAATSLVHRCVLLLSPHLRA